MKEYKINHQQLDVLVKYLAMKPFAEVQQIIAFLQTLPVIEEKKDVNDKS